MKLIVEKRTWHSWQKTKHETAVWTIGDYEGFNGRLVEQMHLHSYKYTNNELLWELPYVTEVNSVMTEAMGLTYSICEEMFGYKPMLWLDVTDNRLEGNIQHIVDWCQSRDIMVGVRCHEKDHTLYKTDVWIVSPFRTPFMSGVVNYSSNVKFVERQGTIASV